VQAASRAVKVLEAGIAPPPSAAARRWCGDATQQIRRLPLPLLRVHPSRRRAGDQIEEAQVGSPVWADPGPCLHGDHGTLVWSRFLHAGGLYPFPELPTPGDAAYTAGDVWAARMLGGCYTAEPEVALAH
jgi:hypothetical protein